MDRPTRLLHRLYRRLADLLNARIDPNDITVLQCLAMETVLDGTASTPGELARSLLLGTGSATHLIDGLERRGLMRRERDATDRRIVRLELTEDGRADLAGAMPTLSSIPDRVFADIRPNERSLLSRLMGKALEARGHGATWKPTSPTDDSTR